MCWDQQVNGGYGAGGRRGAGRGPGGSGNDDDEYGVPGYGGPGYAGPDGYGQPGYGQPGYGQPGYGGPDSGSRNGAGGYGAGGSAADWPAGYGQSGGAGGGSYGGYGGQGPGWQDFERTGGQGPGGQGPGGQGPGGQGAGGQGPVGAQGSGGYGQGSGQPGGRGPRYGQAGRRPDPRSRDQRGAQGAQQYNPRTGPQPTQRGGEWQQGTGPGPVQRGLEPARTAQAPRGRGQRGSPRRGAAAGRAGDGYPGGYQARGDAQSGQGDYEGWNPEAQDDSFVPGFGRREEFDPGRPPGPGRGGGYPGDPGRYGGGYEDYDDGGRGRRGRRRRDDPGGEDDWYDGDEGRRRRGPVRRLAPWVALLVILIPLIIGGVYVYHLYENKYHPADYSGAGIGPAVTFEVKSGDDAFSIAPRLQALGVIASARAFEDAAENTSGTTGLEAGYYRLNHHMQASLAWAALLNPKNRIQLTVTIPEGKRVSQVVLILAKATSIPLADFQQVINHPAQLGLPSYANGKVEGYLFPDTYEIQPNETALQILQAMVQAYNAEARQANLASAAKKVGLTPEKVIIEASMAQAEGGSLSDYPKIARVIINRLNAGMKLQFDSVLLYGLGKYAVNVTDAQIATPGPYNDFQHAGLPPTPICNPGNAAIQAILHPQPGDWLYFLTKPGGHSEFSATPLPGQ
jgi:uncharacterized YceG family protein